MTLHWQTLAQRIRMEIAEIDQAVDTATQHWQRYQNAIEDRPAFLNSVALNLHSFYNGTERALELIAREMDGGPLGGDMWHTELLRQMRLELPDVRPAVLSEATCYALDEYRKFRHLVRHSYATRLEAAKIVPLVEKLPATWQQVKSQLLDFAEFLSELSR